MSLKALLSCEIGLVLLVFAGCGDKMTDDSTSTAGTSAGSGGALYGSAGSSGAAGAAPAGQSGTGGTAGSQATAGATGAAGSPGTAGFTWPGISGTGGFTWPGISGTGGVTWPATSGTGGVPDWQNWGGIPLTDAPEAVQDTVASELGDATVDRVQQNEEDGAVTYEVMANVDGSRVELTIAEDGTLIRKTEEIDPESLPQAVQDTVAQEAADLEITRAEKVTEDGEVYYEVRVGSRRDRINLTIAEDGTLIEDGGGDQQQ